MEVEIDQTPRTTPPSGLEAVTLSVDSVSLRVRLARAILDLAECAEIDVANSVFVTGAVSNNTLAALAGGKPKTVARMIEQFKLRGLVETRRERFIIRQPEKLRNIVSRST